MSKAAARVLGQPATARRSSFTTPNVFAASRAEVRRSWLKQFVRPVAIRRAISARVPRTPAFEKRHFAEVTSRRRHIASAFERLDAKSGTKSGKLQRIVARQAWVEARAVTYREATLTSVTELYVGYVVFTSLVGLVAVGWQLNLLTVDLWQLGVALLLGLLTVSLSVCIAAGFLLYVRSAERTLPAVWIGAGLGLTALVFWLPQFSGAGSDPLLHAAAVVIASSWFLFVAWWLGLMGASRLWLFVTRLCYPRNVEAETIVQLVELVDALQGSSLVWESLTAKQQLVKRFERLAATVHHDLSESVHLGDAASQARFSESIRATAARLRELKLNVLLPDPETRAATGAELRVYLERIADGQWHDLRPSDAVPPVVDGGRHASAQRIGSQLWTFAAVAATAVPGAIALLAQPLPLQDTATRIIFVGSYVLVILSGKSQKDVLDNFKSIGKTPEPQLTPKALAL